MEFKIPKETLEEVLNYLKDKPWAEVTKLMYLLTNLEKIDENIDDNNTK